MKKDQVKKCDKISKYYGRANQEMQSVSELFELGEVITRRPDQRGSDWKDKLLDEIADVRIMLQQLCLLYDISKEDVEDKIDEKLNRQIERMKNGG
ncbi:MAG: hypothetical protein J6U54_01185 [Clostridiales bacterium]|nr:hypothetical protein [Clostridiales bacterium]